MSAGTPKLPTVTGLAALLADGKASAVELAQDALAKAKADQHGAFLHIEDDLTLGQARRADEIRTAFKAANAHPDQWPKLLGIPIAHKDIFVTRGWRSTAGSKMLANYVSPFDATVVTQLADAGAVCIGKLNCDEFAMGSSNENSAFGVVKNPLDPSRIPGGSSGGSAAAVAAGVVPATTGTDTGGSLRQPAAMCGITAIKPTYGRVSRYGMIAFASSLDQGGPMAHTAEDCALVLDAMSGFDPNDSTSLDVNKCAPTDKVSIWRGFSAEIARNTAPNKEFAGLRVGVPKEFFADGLAPAVRAKVEAAIAFFVSRGAERVEISLPRTALAIPAYYVIAPAEASSNLARFDGVRYGHRAADYTDLNDMIAKSRAEGFGREVQRRILTGTYVLSHGYYDAYYLQAQRVRRLIAQDFQHALAQCDLIMGPVAPTTAWKFGEKSADPVAMYLEDIFTLGVSLAGLPGMSVPCGIDDSQLPIGLQIIGNYFDEARMLAVAHRYQQLTGQLEGLS
jgi:aspartyl-tRNA(Asn)/glutamyl-tRNA(Gln) amidotransferase subunit A